MKRAFIGIALIAVIGLSLWYSMGSADGARSDSFGARTGATVTAIADIRNHPGAYLNRVVTIEGEMTRECPSSGCWWYVKDPSGEIRADSTAGGFALPPKQQGRKIRTTGKLVRIEGGELEIAAVGAELH